MNTAEQVLNEVEERIRNQMQAAPKLSMEWRMAVACLAHLNDVRVKYGLYGDGVYGGE